MSFPISISKTAEQLPLVAQDGDVIEITDRGTTRNPAVRLSGDQAMAPAETEEPSRPKWGRSSHVARLPHLNC
jgi:hypothetical protein